MRNRLVDRSTQPAVDNTRESQSRERSASLRTLDHRSVAPPEILSPGGTQPGDSRVAGETERASFPQAGRIALQSVSQRGETGSGTVTGRALRHEPVGASHR